MERRFLHLWDSPGQFLGELAVAAVAVPAVWWLSIMLYALS